MARLDAVQPQALEAEVHHCPGRFRTKALAPIRLADPVAELRPLVLGLDPQADRTQQPAVFLPRDGKDGLLAAVEPVAVVGDPSFGHAVFIRVRDLDRGRGHVSVARQPLHLVRVGHAERPQQEAGGFQARLRRRHGQLLIHPGQCQRGDYQAVRHFSGGDHAGDIGAGAQDHVDPLERIELRWADFPAPLRHQDVDVALLIAGLGIIFPTSRMLAAS